MDYLLIKIHKNLPERVYDFLLLGIISGVQFSL